jgi:hypothetical protein
LLRDECVADYSHEILQTESAGAVGAKHDSGCVAASRSLS